MTLLSASETVCETVCVGHILSQNVLVFIVSVYNVCVCAFECEGAALAGISRWRLSVITGHGGVLLLWLLLYCLNCLEDKTIKEQKERTKKKRKKEESEYQHTNTHL